jgi:hypothetical protein
MNQFGAFLKKQSYVDWNCFDDTFHVDEMRIVNGAEVDNYKIDIEVRFIEYLCSVLGNEQFNG